MKALKQQQRPASKVPVFKPVIAAGSDIREIVKALFPNGGNGGWKALVERAEMFLIYSGPKIGYAA